MGEINTSKSWGQNELFCSFTTLFYLSSLAVFLCIHPVGGHLPFLFPGLQFVHLAWSTARRGRPGNKEQSSVRLRPQEESRAPSHASLHKPCRMLSFASPSHGQVMARRRGSPQVMHFHTPVNLQTSNGSTGFLCLYYPICCHLRLWRKLLSNAEFI